jgi:hypothetical protein
MPMHCIYHTAEMAEARSRGGLRANGFVRLRKLFQNGRPLLEIDELGQYEKIVSDRLHQETAGRFRETGREVVAKAANGRMIKAPFAKNPRMILASPASFVKGIITFDRLRGSAPGECQR